jgi:hypothetical protein
MILGSAPWNYCVINKLLEVFKPKGLKVLHEDAPGTRLRTLLEVPLTGPWNRGILVGMIGSNCQTLPVVNLFTVATELWNHGVAL